MTASSPESHAKHLADELRSRLDLGNGPIKDLFELAFLAADVDVLSMDAPDEEHGLSMTDTSTGRTVVAVSTTPHAMRQRSSIAHELGHILAGDPNQEGSLPTGQRNHEEQRADAFARHLLLPSGWVEAKFASGQAALHDLSEIVQEFSLSPAMATIQLHKVGVVDRVVCDEWMRQYSRTLAARFGWLSQYQDMCRASQRPRAPQRLMARAATGYKAGIISSTELAQWYGRPAEELEELLGPPDLMPETDDGDDDDFWGVGDRR